MATTVFRTAHSAVVRDAMDFSAALCAPSGETVAQAVTIPLQLGSIPNAMKTLLEKFGGSFAPGDVYLVNDPFDGASHTPDLLVVKPSFAAGRPTPSGCCVRSSRAGPTARPSSPTTSAPTGSTCATSRSTCA